MHVVNNQGVNASLPTQAPKHSGEDKIVREQPELQEGKTEESMDSPQTELPEKEDKRKKERSKQKRNQKSKKTKLMKAY